MKKQVILIIGWLALFPLMLHAEEKPERWNLTKCINYALEHNIQVKKSKVAWEQSGVDTKLAKAQFFPSLSASVGQSFVNYPSDNAVTNNSYSGNYGVSAAWKLFDGGKRVNAVKQQEIQNQVQQLDIAQSEDDIEIAIIQTYLQVLYAHESVRINENTLAVSEVQRKRGEELLNAGSISQNDYAQLKSQCSTDKYQLVVAQSNLNNYKLQMKQLLELDIMEEIHLEIPELSPENVLVPLPDKQTVYNTSLAVRPQIECGKLSVDMAQLEVKRGKSGYLPSISFNAGISSGHLSGTDYSAGSQLLNKFNENIGFTLSIPISSNRENRSAVEKATLATYTSELELLNTQKELLKTVEGIYLDAVSAQDQFVAASERVEAVGQSYELISEQYALGMKNTLELLTEKNNLLSAEQEMIQSKYMAILSIQLLNFYQDKPIQWIE